MFVETSHFLESQSSLLASDSSVITDSLPFSFSSQNNQLYSEDIDLSSVSSIDADQSSLETSNLSQETELSISSSSEDPLLSFSESSSVTSTWTPLYEPGVGGWLTSFGISPHDSDVIIAGGDMLGVAYSHDGGNSWLGGQGLKSWEIEEITFDPNDPNKIWLATKSGPYLSVDQGKTWTEKRNGMPDFEWAKYVAPVQEILINPNDTNHLLAFTGHQRDDYATETHRGEVYQSIDNGESWQLLSQIGSQVNNNIYDVDFSANDFSQLFASTTEGLFKSSNGGQNWTQIGTDLPLGKQKSLATHSTDSNTLLVTVNGQGIYRSTDGGQNFSAVNTGINISDMSQSFFDQVRFSEHNPDIAFVGERKTSGNYLSQDGGLTWTKVGGYEDGSYSMENKYFRAFDIDPNNYQTIIGGTGEGIWLTEDLGNSWQDVSSTEVSENHWRGNGYSGLVVLNFEWDQFHTDQSFVAAMDSGKWMSRDDLSTWEWAGGERGNGISDFSGLIDVSFTNTPTDQQVIYGIVGQNSSDSSRGIYVSFNGGNTWQKQSIPLGTGKGTKIVAHPTETNKAWLVWDNKLLFSSDYGQTWTQKLETVGDVYELAPDYTSETFQIYVGTQTGLWQSSDLNGNNYNLVPNSDIDAWGITQIEVVDHDTLYAVNAKRDGYTERGIWKYDQGIWTQLTDNTSDSSNPFRWVADVAVDPTNSQRILAATDQDPFLSVSGATGVWLSEDGGITWQQFNEGLSMLRVKNVQFKPDDSGTVVIGTTGGGLYQTQIGGDSTAPNTHVNLSDINFAGENSYTFQVTYTDNAGVDLTSLDHSDLTITSDHGFSGNAILDNVTSTGNGTTAIATYHFDAPDGTWDVSDNGIYTLTLNSQQVHDTNGNLVIGGNLDTFTVDIAQKQAFEQDSNGLVTIEAEQFHDNLSPDGVHQWVVLDDTAASEGQSMISTPDNGTNNNTGYDLSSPRLDYAINFSHTGTHYVWILGKAGGSNVSSSNSVHVGLNGQMISSSDRIDGFIESYGWSNDTMDSTRATLEITSTGIQTLNLWMREDGFIADQIILTTDPNFDPTQPQTQAFEQDSNGLVTIEAEQFHDNLSPDGVHQWVVLDDTAASGGQAMISTPDNGTNNNTGYDLSSPRLDYEINFSHTGTHYVWILGKAGETDSHLSDSVHVGLNEQTISTSDRISSFTSDYSWSNDTMDSTRATLEITSTGIQTLNLWMREDGFVADRILLTTDPNFDPLNG